MSKLQFQVIGNPAAQGSKRHVGKGIMVESSKQLGPWRDSVAWAAKEAMLKCSWEMMTGPAVLVVSFHLRGPKKRKKDDVVPTRKPDLDKLTRAIGDALKTAGVYRDDSQIVCSLQAKHYATGETGAVITVLSWAWDHEFEWTERVPE